LSKLLAIAALLCALTTISLAGTTYTMVQSMSGWQTCDTCAGSGSTPHSMTQHISNPSMTGNATQYWLGGSSPYHNAIWWKQLGANPNVSNFTYDLYFYLKTPGAAQALEFDVNQSVNNHKFIFGTECNIRGGNQWDVWDTAGGRWVHTGIGCSQPPAYQWNHLVLEFQRVGTQTKFISVTLNGHRSYINRTFNTWRERFGTQRSGAVGWRLQPARLLDVGRQNDAHGLVDGQR
jgi:hypothetical protein